jgi:plastocyanin
MVKIAAFICAAVVVAGCGSTSNSSSGSGSSTSASSGGGAYGSTPAASKKTSAKTPSQVELYDNYFQPKTISGKPGAKVTVELKNEGKAEHTFTIDSQKVDDEVKPGKTAKVTFTIPKSGSMAFYCKYHKAAGMTGTLKAS